MRSFFERMAWKMERFMQGRNGQDGLARASYWLGFILLVLSLFMSATAVGSIVSILAFAAMFYALFRMFSKNIDKRQREDRAFMDKTEGVRRTAEQQKLRFSERKEYKFCRCKCGTTLRFRRGQGTKEFTCPRCKAKMTVKT